MWEIVAPRLFGNLEPPRPVKNRSSSWAELRDCYLEKERVVLPQEHFSVEGRVEDQPAFRIGENHSILLNTNPSIESGCIVILLESPHREEYGEADIPKAPLQNCNSRRGLKCNLEHLLKASELWLQRLTRDESVSLEGLQIVLANAVQYQASLNNLLKDRDDGLHRPIRNCIWKLVFRNGGAEEMVDRLNGYAPTLVLAAPTAPVREELAAYLGWADTSWPWRFIDRHPSIWLMQRPALRNEPCYEHHPSA